MFVFPGLIAFILSCVLWLAVLSILIASITLIFIVFKESNRGSLMFLTFVPVFGILLILISELVSWEWVVGFAKVGYSFAESYSK